MEKRPKKYSESDIGCMYSVYVSVLWLYDSLVSDVFVWQTVDDMKKPRWDPETFSWMFEREILFRFANILARIVIVMLYYIFFLLK